MTLWSITTGVSTIATLLLSILAAILCAELYLLLSTGMLGKMWRTLALSVAIFAAAEVVSFGETVGLIGDYGVSHFLRMSFLALLCIGFWQQRQAFARALGIKHGSVLRALSSKFLTHRYRVKAAKTNTDAEPQTGQPREALGSDN